MKKVWFFFDYGTWPVWYQDEHMDCRESGLPICVADNQELNKLMMEIEEEYEGLFINNSYEFTFVGFKNNIDKVRFYDKVNNFIKLLREKIEPEYAYISTDWESDFE